MSDRPGRNGSGGEPRRFARRSARRAARTGEGVSRRPGEWTGAFSIGGRRLLVFGAPGKGAEQSAATSKPLLKWLIGGALAVVAVAAAVGVARNIYSESQPQHPSQVSDVSVTGLRLPLFSEPLDDPAVGTVAPSVLAITFEGDFMRVPVGDGTATVVGFYAHWCLECKRELPRVSAWLLQNPLPRVRVVAVSTQVIPDRSNYPPSEWFAEVGWPGIVVRDSGSSEIGRAYGLTTLPFTVVIDDRGKVIARIAGELTDAQWETLVAAAAGAVA